MDLEHALATVLSLAPLGLAIVLRRLSGTWATPGGLFCGYWFLFSFFSLVALPGAPVNPLAMLYVVAACVVFALPTFTTDWRTLLAVNAVLAPARQPYLASPVLRHGFRLSFAVSVAFVLIDLLVQGISLEEVAFNFFATSQTYLEKRYEDELAVNMFGQWGLIFAYLCVSLGGIRHAQTRGAARRFGVMLMAMAPSILIMLVQAAKGLFFVSIALLLGGHLVVRLMTDTREHIDLRALARQAQYLVLALPLIIVAFLARGLHNIDDSGEVQERVLNYLGAYAFLHIPTFSDWFTHAVGQPSQLTYPDDRLTLGLFTFSSLSKLVGVSRQLPPGTYDEYFAYSELSPGNIYTMFRGLMQDFGLVGSFVMLYLAGMLFNAAFKYLLASRWSPAALALVFLFVNFLYSSWVISVFIYNSTYLVAVLWWLVFALAGRVVRPAAVAPTRDPVFPASR